MLLNFTVKNYKSIGDEQQLSLVAGTSSARDKSHSFSTNSTLAPFALRAACIMGPNASGKSSLIEALGFFSEFVGSSAKEMSIDDKINVKPFLLKKSTKNRPTEFEVTFVFKEKLIQYGFSATHKQVHSEWMFEKPNIEKTRMRLVFKREYDKSTKDYIWYTNRKILETTKSQDDAWKDSTRSNTLFLSTSVMLNSDVLSGPYTWINKYLRIIQSTERLSSTFTARQSKDNKIKTRLLKFIQSADLMISDFEVDEKENEIPKEFEELFRDSALEIIRKNNSHVTFDVKTRHIDAHGEAVHFDLEDESSGTQVLFSLAGPWLDVLDNGYTLIVDELHNSLHPLALRYLVKAFNDPKINTNKAQLIFTTHETSIISKDLLHKDQIWFIEKTQKGLSQLSPLSSFEIRDTEAFQRAYLGGRYGALPKIRSFINE